MRKGPALGTVFRVALYYGVAGFGGGYSVLAQLRRDLVERSDRRVPAGPPQETARLLAETIRR